MKAILKKYLKQIREVRAGHDAREESFYPVLRDMLILAAEALGREIRVTILPAHTAGGNPDLCIYDAHRRVIGYVEAKTADHRLDDIENTEQMRRYNATFPNVMLTNFVEFRTFRNGMRTDAVLLGRPEILGMDRTPPLIPDAVDAFRHMTEYFFAFNVPGINNSRDLARELAMRARFLRDEVIRDELKHNRDMQALMEAFKKALLPELDEKQFADLFSQTAVYGMFTAWLQTPTDTPFDRRDAYREISASLGVLHEMARFTAELDDNRGTAALLDDIATVLAATDKDALEDEFRHRSAGKNDPIIHFYETFLQHYDPDTRERRGVYYTPDPVVKYIVNSIDYMLRDRFDKPDGLAEPDVTLLDPAAGTMTFCVAAMRKVHETLTGHGTAMVNARFKDQVLTNFHAFELMVAPYVVGHMKAGLVMRELGFPLRENERFQLYLTNSLDLTAPVKKYLGFMEERLARENRDAWFVKSEKPILVITGNPPYSGHSANNMPGVQTLMRPGDNAAERFRTLQSYYTVDGHDLDERNPKWLQDDYVKFIRLAQWKVAQVDKGVVGFITNHSWLDNPTFRGMRQSLMTTFSRIYVLNLHGNSLKRETAPDGSADENVFDIRQGTAITIMVRDTAQNSPCQVFYADLWGRREQKYAFLENHSVPDTDFREIKPVTPWYWFVPMDTALEGFYLKQPSVNDMFVVKSVGIVTARDKLTIGETREEVWNRVRAFAGMDPEMARAGFNLGKDVRDWKVSLAQKDIKDSGIEEKYLTRILYRPFDTRWTYYTGKTKGFICMPRREVMLHMLTRENLGLMTTRQMKTTPKWQHCLITDQIIESSCVSNRTSEITYLFPLYTYPQEGDVAAGAGRMSNIKKPVLDALGDAFHRAVKPEEVLNYIYAVLYAPDYRERFRDFLRHDFPRVPFTADRDLFEQLSALGRELIRVHLLEPAALGELTEKFDGPGDPDVEKIRYDAKTLRIYINKSAYFHPVSPREWEYMIGGYQVLHKYLKDRKGQRLSDPMHYLRIIRAIKRTLALQNEINALYAGVEQDTVDIEL